MPADAASPRLLGGAAAGSDALVLGIDSDRLFPVPGQREIARHLPGNIDGDDPVVISSPFGMAWIFFNSARLCSWYSWTGTP